MIMQIFVILSALIFGIICLCLTYVASHMGGILQAALALFGMLGAPMLGLFTLGMIFPWANKWGAYSGLGTSLVMMFWIGIGAYVTKPDLGRAPISLDGCPNTTTFTNLTQTMSNYTYSTTASLYNTTTTTPSAVDHNPVDELYTLSYVWYSFTAMLIVIFVGMTVTLITGKNDPKMIDGRLTCPLFDIICPCFPEKILKPLRFGVNHENKHTTKPSESEIALKENSSVPKDIVLNENLEGEILIESRKAVNGDAENV